MAISVVTLAVIIGGAGLAYTYFLGPNSDQSATAVEEPVPAPRQEIKASKPAANAVVSASVSLLSSPVAPGENTSVTIKTVATAKCTIAVAYGSVVAKDSGLTPKVADEFGTVSWAWTVDEAAALGTWPVKVTCVYNGRSAVVQADLVVANTQ